VLNKVFLIGRATADPELRYTQDGTPVARFRIAVNRPGKDRGTDFVPILAWRKTAEFAAQHVKKGRLLAVEGRLQIRDYEAADGKRRRVGEVVVDRLRLLDRKPQEQEPEVEPETPDAPEDIGGEPALEEDL
jgi:single-strand DNA-binding protein